MLKSVLLKENLGTTNGIELSPDEKILYVNESVQKKIWTFEVTDNGELLNQQLFYEFVDFGLDGMKCDVKGNIPQSKCNSCWPSICNAVNFCVLREISIKALFSLSSFSSLDLIK